MAATRRCSNGKEVRQHGRKGKRLNGWHNGRMDGRRWLKAVERLDKGKEGAA